MQEWLTRRGRIYWYDQYALNEQATAFAKYDPERVVAEMVATGADIVVVYVANQFSIAYYPSGVWPQHPNLHGRDYVGEVIGGLRRAGKKVVAYINWLESRHPEWNVVPLGTPAAEAQAEMPLASWADPADPDRRVQAVPGGHWRFACMNSPRREQVLAVAREVCERYRPDFFHLDMFHAVGAICVCPRCRPTIERICGTEAVTREAIRAHWREYIDWRHECSASLIRELTAVLHERGVLAAHNAGLPLHAPSLYSVGEEWMPNLDVYVSEIFSNLHVPGPTVRLQRALGLPSWELLTSAPPAFAHHSVPLAWWQLSAAACRANGGEVLGPCGVGAFPDTTSSPRLLATVRAGYEAFMRDADLAPGAVSLAKVALVFSWATRKYLREGAMDWSEEIEGWSRLLVEEHVPFDFVVAEKVTDPAALARYDLVILPNSAHVSDAFCTAVTEYVRAGGRILATAETSLADERGYRRADFALAGVLGVSRRGAATGALSIDRGGEPEPAWGVFQQVAAEGEVLARHVAVDPAGSVAGARDPLPMAPSGWPVAVRHACGRGQGAYVAFDIGRFYTAHGLPQTAGLMIELVDALLPAGRQLRVRAPRSVEVTLWQQPAARRTIVYLADRTQSPGDLTRVTETIPVHNIEIALPASGPRPRVRGRGCRVRSSVADGWLRVQVAALDVCAAVVVVASGEESAGG